MKGGYFTMDNNSTIQIINSEKAVAMILSNFSSEFIMDVIDDNIKMKFRPYNVGPANFSIVLEQDFKTAKMQNPSFVDQIEEVRAKTHREIINRICMHYQLQFVGEEDDEYTPDQLATLSSILFDIFVSNFTPKMVWFFGRYIIDNKDDIYNSIENLEDLKKNKDLTGYGKRIYSDSKLIAIHANLNSVLENIAGHDIPFQVLLPYLTDPNTAAYLSQIIVDCGDIYQHHYASYILNPITRSDIFTVVKFQLQSMADKIVVPIENN